MTLKQLFAGVQDFGHALLPLAGIATAGSAVIAVFLNKLGIPQDTTLAAIAAIGAASTGASKWIDSRSYTNLQAEAIRADAAVRAAVAAVSKGNVVGAITDIAQLAPPLPPPAP